MNKDKRDSRTANMRQEMFAPPWWVALLPVLAVAMLGLLIWWVVTR